MSFHAFNGYEIVSSFCFEKTSSYHPHIIIKWKTETKVYTFSMNIRKTRSYRFLKVLIIFLFFINNHFFIYLFIFEKSCYQDDNFHQGEFKTQLKLNIA